MNKRVVLSRIIRAMLSVLAIAFLFILFRSLGGPPLASSSNTAFDNVVIGQTALRRLGRQRVWVTRLSASQVRQADELSSFVIDPQSGCAPSTSLCVIAAQSSRPGIEIVYSHTIPDKLASNIPWYGGYVDPVSGGIFDVLGRAYNSVKSNDKRVALDLIDQY